MLQKGIISQNFRNADVEEFLQGAENWDGETNGAQPEVDARVNHNKGSSSRRKEAAAEMAKSGMVHTEVISNPSITTIYKEAVPKGTKSFCFATEQNLSSSSDEIIDTSAEEELNTVVTNLNISGRSIVGNSVTRSNAVQSDRVIQEVRQNKQPTPEERADDMIKEAEKSRTHMYELSGKETSAVAHLSKSKPPLSVQAIDEDYQMLDPHVDEATKDKIRNFEYIDFARLLPRNKGFLFEEDQQRLEFMSRNGQTFLAPIAERELSTINSYNKWGQAFRIYSNILMTVHPSKVNELLQYNHIIHSTSFAYLWDNVYAYDKEFRHHVSHHPTCSWAIILQQAWTLLIKDDIDSEGLYGKGSPGGHNHVNEPCRCFNRGKCTFQPSCKFEHCCSIKKCGKFRQGAHIC